MSAEQVVSSCKALEERTGKSLMFMAEMRARDEDPEALIPLDYKVYTFHGVTKFVLQVDRNYRPPRMAFFDGDFRAINDNRVTIPDQRASTRGVHRLPACAEELLELARQVTLKLNGAFISVDCYATPDGPVLGELTHTPGGPWYRKMFAFSDSFECELGGAWLAANERLGIPLKDIKIPYYVRQGNELIRVIY